MLIENFKNGINLGGYLSQYEIITVKTDEETLRKHFNTFIAEGDIKQIAAWKFDHVRIPLEGKLFLDPKNKKLKQDPMAYLMRCIDWCEKYNLNVILDLHNIWGHVFGQMQSPTPLMIQKDLQNNFVTFWTEMANALKGYDKIKVMFELFNEIADSTGYCWNRLYKQTISAIRHIDQNRWILVGTNNVNSIGYLDRLDLVEDQGVFYNFHYYEPNVFTHQKACFSEEFTRFSKTVNYPDQLEEYLLFLKKNPQYLTEHPMFDDTTLRNDEALMDHYLTYAQDFITYSGHELYCSEFGVIDTAPEAEAIKWITDYLDKCNQLNIGHAMWNYKCLDFELVDIHNEIVRPKLLDALIELNDK